MRKAAVLIGVDKTGGLTPLASASTGARQVARWLKREGFDVRCLSDASGPVTIEKVAKAVRGFVTLPPRYHLLLVYFSGHGQWHARSDVWLLSGAPTEPLQAINLQASMDLARYSGIPNVVFVSDACRSIPGSRGGARVEGGPAFPNYDEIVNESKVDFFKATSEARPAYEGKIDGTPQSVLTAALMAAYAEPEAYMVRELVEGDETIEVVPNRRLEVFLQRKVDALLEGIDPNASQQIVANVPSSEDVYIARIRRPKRAALGPPPGRPGLVTRSLAPHRRPVAARAAGHALLTALSTRHLFGGSPNDLMLSLDDAGEHGVRQRMPGPGGDDFDTGTGFIVRGAVVRRCAATTSPFRLRASLLAAGDGRSAAAIVRVEGQPTLRVPAGDVGSVMVQFGDGRCVVLAALPGFIGHVVVADHGVANVSYVPSASQWRFSEYRERQGTLDRLRAMVALALDGETFHVRSEREAEALAGRIRMYKGVDPTLGVYAALAFSQAGNERQVLGVLEHMREDLGADLFDVRLLASRHPAGHANVPVVPFCPLLTQSWSLLRGRRVDIAGPTQEFAASLCDSLCDSLWTTFQPAAGEALFEAVANAGTR